MGPLSLKGLILLYFLLLGSLGRYYITCCWWMTFEFCFLRFSLEAYQTLGCHWLFHCRVHLSLMSLVAWQFKPCNDRWKKLPLRCLKSKEDWCHLGPEMSAKIQKWWDNEEREDSIKAVDRWHELLQVRLERHRHSRCFGSSQVGKLLVPSC